MNLIAKDDKDILELYAQSDEGSRQQAFTWLVEKYSNRVYWLVRGVVVSHVDSDDVVQNVFIKIWRELPNFRAQSSLYTWIYRIAINESLTLLRSRRTRYSVSIDDVQLESFIDSEGLYGGDRVEQALGRVVLRLPAKQRAVFNMRYFEEMPYSQMAEVMSTSEGALKASYHHAVKKVERWIEEELDN